MSTSTWTRGLAVAAAAALALPAIGSAGSGRHAATRSLRSHGPKSFTWFHWNERPSTTPGRSTASRGTVVIGLERMADVGAVREEYGLTHVQAIPALHAVQARTRLGTLVARARDDARIRYVSPVGERRHPLAMPNDPMLRTVDPGTTRPFEWQFAAAHVDRALELSPGSPHVLVGVLDTGVADVPDLAGKVDGRWGFADGATAPQEGDVGIDEVGHGTAVASLIAANVDDGFGMAGFGGASHVVSFRVDNRGWTDSVLAAGLMKLDSLGVRIINMSLGGNAPSGPILLDAIHKVAEDGVLLVAATGNNHGFVAYPAADLQPAGGKRSYGLAVGASDAGDAVASFSNYGSHLSLVAPGNYAGACSGVLVAIAPESQLDGSCYPNWTGGEGARYAYLPGTSFSSPEVAGVAALVWAARPELTNYQVADIIKQSARRPAGAWSPTLGCGILDAGAALELATDRAAWQGDGHAADEACAVGARSSVVWPDRTPPPTLRALPATGKRGAKTTLRYEAGEDTYAVAAALAVRRHGKTIERRTSRFTSVNPGEAYGFSWRSPKTGGRAAYTFCITLTNREGIASAPSCAPIDLR